MEKAYNPNQQVFPTLVKRKKKENVLQNLRRPSKSGSQSPCGLRPATKEIEITSLYTTANGGHEVVCKPLLLRPNS